MTRLMDDENLARVVAESFLEDIPRQIIALKGYLEDGDISGVERQAHTIKGASANVSGEALRAIASKMEMDGRAGNLDSVKGCLVELESQFYLLKETIIKEL
jgi:HPt (histidine-containing phosphotransfer) domain-containing protein